MLSGVTVSGSLVVRDVKSGKVVSTTPVDLDVGEEAEQLLFFAYHTNRPQYSPDGRWIYLCAAHDVMSVNPALGLHRRYGVGLDSSLSPKGDVVSVSLERTLALVHKDGRTAICRRLEESISQSGMVWVGEDRLAVLTVPKDSESRPELHFFGRDGSVLGSKVLQLPETGGDENTGELAIAPDGRHMVVAYGVDVYFMNSSGEVLKHWESDGEMLAQPTFAPDSKHVAFKSLAGEDTSYKRVDSIVFFKPDGTEASRIAVPPIDPATTQPAAGSPNTGD
jgi:hypothetical protein